MGRAQESYYKRKPGRALKGFVGLSLEEVGAYNILMELMYFYWSPLADDDDRDRRGIVNHMGCAVQKANPIIRRLIEKGRIRRIQIAGKWVLTDDQFERERQGYTGKSAPGNADENPGEASKSAGEVGEKSGRSQGEVSEKSPLLGHKTEENHDDTQQNRIEYNKKEKEKVSPGSKPKAKRGRKSRGGAEAEADKPAWPGDPDLRAAVAADMGEGFAGSYIDTAIPIAGGLRTRTRYAADKLRTVAVLQGLRIEGPDPP